MAINAAFNEILAIVAILVLLVWIIKTETIQGVQRFFEWSETKLLGLRTILLTLFLYVFFRFVGIVGDMGSREASPFVKRFAVNVELLTRALRRPTQKRLDYEALLRYSYRIEEPSFEP